MTGLFELYLGSANRHVKKHVARRTIAKISREEVDLNVLTSLDASDLDPAYKFSWYNAILHGDLFTSYWVGIKIDHNLSSSATKPYTPDPGLLSFPTPPVSPSLYRSAGHITDFAKDSGSKESASTGIETAITNFDTITEADDEHLATSSDKTSADDNESTAYDYSRRSSTSFIPNSVEYSSLTGTLVPKKHSSSQQSGERRVRFADSEIAALNAASRNAEEDEAEAGWTEKKPKKGTRNQKRKLIEDKSYTNRSKRPRGGVRGGRAKAAATPKKGGLKNGKKGTAAEGTIDGANDGVVFDSGNHEDVFATSTPTSFGVGYTEPSFTMPYHSQAQHLSPPSLSAGGGDINVAANPAAVLQDVTSAHDSENFLGQQYPSPTVDTRPLMGFAALMAADRAKTKNGLDELFF